MGTPILNIPTQDFLQKTLGAALSAGVTASATLNNVTGITNGLGIMIVDRVDANGTETPNKVEVIKFTATSGSTVTTLTRGLAGTTDQDHAISAVVEFSPDVLWAQAIMDGLSQVITSAGVLDTTKVVDLTSSQNLLNKMLSGATLSAPTIRNPLISVGSDAVGDLYYGNSGSTLSRIPLGNLNEAIVANASLPQYKPIANRSPFITLTDASTMYLDFAVGHKWLATIVPSGARTFLATNATLGYIGMLRIAYASTASLAINFMNAGATMSWAANTTLVPTATLNKADEIGLVVTGPGPKFDLTIIGQNYSI